ncbi:MAG: hypothetical protein HY427_02580 [Candidatus Levybacteria bacterium]|nr:hypothetical protein [Candidatus Levybacteria bacterium]
MKIKYLLIIILIILAFYTFSAWSQYTWADRFRAEVESDWMVFDEQKNAADLIYPYTLFAPPVSRLGLIQRSSIVELNNGVFKYNKMWADGPIGNSIPTETFLSFADCNQKMSGNLKEGKQEFGSVDDIEWSKPDDNPYVSSEKDKQRLIEVFNYTCELLVNSR